ncbi:MAG: PaaI family thioesterase [Reyranellaceae bacterium]
MPVLMDASQLEAFLREEFPEAQANVTVKVDAVGEGRITVRALIDERHLRPGGVVSGPTMMWLADCGTYLLILSQIGKVALAVTTNLNINFLRPGPAGRDLIGEARLLKLGQRLAVAEMSIFSDGQPEPIAHVTLTYSIPPRDRRGVK